MPTRRSAPRRSARPRWRPSSFPRLLALLAASGALALSGCGKDDFADKTARVSVDGRTTTYQIDACGLDGATAFVVGRAPGGAVLQAVVGVEPDGTTGIVESTGLSVIAADVELAGFGAESWHRRGEQGTPPGAITSARIRGSRIQAAGRLVGVDADGRPDPAVVDEGFAFTLDARCDAASS